MSLQSQNLRRALPAASAFGPLPIAVFGFALFSSAFLIFWVEPYFARMLLPGFGGSQLVWNTCLVFFQVSLLLGYTYAHLLCRYLTVRRQALVHLAVIAVGMIFLPVVVTPEWEPPENASPVLALFAILAATLGAPFFALSANAPLLQHWFSMTRDRQATNPYVLYAASNAGSLCALLAYPFLIEPWITLREQASLWAVLYCGLLVLIAAAGVLAVRSGATSVGTDADESLGPSVAAWAQRLSWLIYVAVPSSLLVGLTSYVSTDIASFPLLWLAPLALYLATFIVTFAARPPIAHASMVRVLPVAIFLAAAGLSIVRFSLGLAIGMHFLAFFLIAMACHGELARLKPPASKLTEFYFWLSLGGVVGGALTALISPLLFNTIVEYPLALACVCLLRTGQDPRQSWIELKSIVLIFGLVVLVLADPFLSISATLSSAFSYSLILLIAAFGLRPRRVNVLLVMLAVLLASHYGRTVTSGLGATARQDRSAYGAYTVTDDREAGYRFLFHGTTIHGVEALRGNERPSPLLYYGVQGPLGDIMRAYGGRSTDVAVIGLGIGSIGCYAESRQAWTFYEIDGLVHRLAAHSGMFRSLSRCVPQAKTVLGDGRLNLVKAGAGIYDLLIVDAFSSDAIPVHLMTREAFVTYRDALKPEGVLVLHVTNRHLDLAPIVGRIAGEAGFVAYERSFTPPKDEQSAQLSPSRWIVLARNESHLRELAADPRWTRRESSASSALWTDDFANILSALK